MDRRGRGALFVLALALLAGSAVAFPHGGLPTYEYAVDQEETYVLAEYADAREYRYCPLGNDDAACALARYARDHGGVLVEDADVTLPAAVSITDDDVQRTYWVHANRTANGTRVLVQRATDLDRLYRLVATDVEDLPPSAQDALDGDPTTVTTSHPPGERRHLVRDDGTWYEIRRVQTREAGVPWWGTILKRGGPLVGVSLLTGLWLTGQRAENAN